MKGSGWAHPFVFPRMCVSRDPSGALVTTQCAESGPKLGGSGSGGSSGGGSGGGAARRGGECQRELWEEASMPEAIAVLLATDLGEQESDRAACEGVEAEGVEYSWRQAEVSGTRPSRVLFRLMAQVSVHRQ